MTKTINQTGGLPMWTRARTTDPETSHKAAASMKDGAESQRGDIVHALNLYGPRTADELDAFCGFRPTTAGRRLSELRESGLARETNETRPTRSGRDATVWKAV